MKKTLALVLAALMAAGMTTVAFAANKDVEKVMFNDSRNEYVIAAYDKDADGVIETGEHNFNLATIAAENNIAGGTKIYLPVYAELEDGTQLAPKDVKKDDVKGWKIYADWTVGEDDAVEPYFDYVKIAGTYQMALVVELPSNDTADNKDLIGTIGLGKTTSDAKKATGNEMVKFGVTYGRDKTAIDTILGNFDGDFGTNNKGAIVEFDEDAEEIDIEFNDLALFTVDVRGQDKLDLRFNTEYDPDFGAMYDYANIDFLTFPGEPRFNRNGTMVIYCEDQDAFLYEVTADGAKAIDAEYVEDEGGFVFRTRELTSYAISDVELDEKTVTEDDSSSTADGGKENPDTGR